MLIRHLTLTDTGGAWTAATRLSGALKSIGVKSSVEVLNESHPKSHIPVRIFAKLDRINENLSKSSMTTSIFRGYLQTRSFYDSMDEPGSKNVYNLHWIPGLLSQRLLTPLSDNKVVWTLHDMNPFTAICHHSFECEGFRENCSNCPQTITSLKKGTKAVFKRKQNFLHQLRDVTFVAPSEWIAEKARESTLLSEFKILSIPNALPTDIIAAKPNKSFRERIHATDQLIVGVLSESYGSAKGGKEAYLELIKYRRRNSSSFKILVFGARTSTYLEDDTYFANDFDVPFLELLATCDLYIHLAIAENLPNIIIEAQSLGVPVIAYDVGGVSEALENAKTGFLVSRTSKSIQTSLMHLIGNSNLRKMYGQRGKEFAQKKFSAHRIASRYADIYEV
jgi:glycosyltransferase involved in cell wall biosynthesis